MSDSESPQNILILGGSYGGVSAAHYALKHVLPALPAGSPYQVVLVSAASQTMCRPACPRALISDDLFDQNKLFVNTAALFEQYPKNSFRFVQGTATKLNHTDRSVTVHGASGGDEVIHFHALIIATGASTPSPLMGLNQDEASLRASWDEVRKVLPSVRTIVISGGGPTGVEAAGELGEYLNGRTSWFGSKPTNPKAITVLTSAAQILPGLRPAIAAKAEGYLARVGVAVMKDARIVSVTPDGAGISSPAAPASLTLSNGQTLKADLYIPATGTRPNTAFIDAALLRPDGRVETNPATLRVDAAGPRIYAVGDAASAARPAVHNILGQIPVLGANLKRDLRLAAGVAESAVGPDREFQEDTRETQMVPIGRSKGVGAAMGFQLPSFLVWLIKGRDYWLWTTGGLWSGKQWAKES